MYAIVFFILRFKKKTFLTDQTLLRGIYIKWLAQESNVQLSLWKKRLENIFNAIQGLDKEKLKLCLKINEYLHSITKPFPCQRQMGAGSTGKGNVLFIL